MYTYVPVQAVRCAFSEYSPKIIDFQDIRIVSASQPADLIVLLSSASPRKLSQLTAKKNIYANATSILGRR
jgi:hypothetical protein